MSNTELLHNYQPTKLKQVYELVLNDLATVGSVYTTGRPFLMCFFLIYRCLIFVLRLIRYNL